MGFVEFRNVVVLGSVTAGRGTLWHSNIPEPRQISLMLFLTSPNTAKFRSSPRIATFSAGLSDFAAKRVPALT
jgi:hypothetical protein